MRRLTPDPAARCRNTKRYIRDGQSLKSDDGVTGVTPSPGAPPYDCGIEAWPFGCAGNDLNRQGCGDGRRL
jgi:hypothetical protein